jgi:hypothetical protein
MATIHGTKEYFLIYAELITAARYHGTVTYQHLAQLIDIELAGNRMGSLLGEILGGISKDEVKLYHRPMLSAVSINVAGNPGPGFFGLAKELGKLTSDDPADQRTFWETERQAVYKAWQRTFKQQT